MAPVPRLRPYGGPAILSYGFRPFFFLGAIYAGLEIALWLPIFFGITELPTAFSPRDWHVHEMLYGYLPAVMTGFLLRAAMVRTVAGFRGLGVDHSLLAVWLRIRTYSFQFSNGWQSRPGEGARALTPGAREQSRTRAYLSHAVAFISCES